MKRKKLKVSILRKCRSFILQFVRDAGVLKSSNISNGGQVMKDNVAYTVQLELQQVLPLHQC